MVAASIVCSLFNFNRADRKLIQTKIGFEC